MTPISNKLNILSKILFGLSQGTLVNKFAGKDAYKQKDY